MRKWQKYNRVIMYLLYVTFISIIIVRFYDDLGNLILFLSLFLCAIINDNLRYYGKINKDMQYYASVLVSIIIGGILEYFVDGYMEVYLFVIMVNIPWIINKKAMKILYTINVFTILFVRLYRIHILEGIGFIDIIREGFMGIIFNLLLISFISVSIFSYVALVVERNKVLKLNKEIEKLTITKERNRIAQDIHDNLGHSLVALNMNLDVVSNILYEDKNKAKELLKKCQQLTKESMNSLRNAVYTLKEEDLSKGLIASINGLIDNINGFSNINILCNIDDRIEDYSFEYKNLVYTTIKESLTNSIKHGEADEIIIELKIEDNIILKIKDNGRGCNCFVKGNGIIGIEERVKKVNGEVEHKTEEEMGFEATIKLPV